MGDEKTCRDQDAWPLLKIMDEVSFTISPIGRLRREDREIAFALEITRLHAALTKIAGPITPDDIGTPVHQQMRDMAKDALDGR